MSNFGGLVQAVGAAWLMTQLTDSATLIALVQASNTLPVMLLAIASGALADIFDRKTLLMAALVFMTLVSAALAVVAWTGGLTPWLLLGFTFMLGAGQAVYNPPWQASMGDLVAREDLPAAVSLNSVGFNLMRSVGPAAGRPHRCHLRRGGGLCGECLQLPAVAGGHGPLAPEPGAADDQARAVRRRHGRGAALCRAVAEPDARHPARRALRFRRHRGSCPAAAGRDQPPRAADRCSSACCLAAIGIGAICGAFLNGRIRARLDNEHVVRLAFVGFASAALLLGLTESVWVHALALIPAGASWVLALSLFNVTVQLSTPRWVVARALALYQTATFGGMAAGSWAWGALAGAEGLGTALTTAGLVLLAGAALGLWLRAPEFGSADLDPANRFREPSLRLDLRGRSGPIMVMVDYRIEQEDVPEFLRLMRLRRNIRRRDGARNWSLLRDLEHPDQWSETYHIATWDEYVRHNLRRTKSDAEVTVALRALHKGEGDPLVHRMIERHTVTPEDDLPLIGKLEIP